MTTKRDKSKTSQQADSHRAAPSHERNQTVRSSEETAAPSGPLVAAYEAGRLHNQLDWHLQQAWLLPVIAIKSSGLHSLEVSKILTGLAPTLTPALSTPAVVRLRTNLLGLRDEWERHYMGAGHKDAFQEGEELIRYELENFDNCSPSVIRENNWSFALRWVDAFASNVLQLLFDHLDENAQKALELGRWVDRGIRPRAAYRFMCQEPTTNSADPISYGVDPFSVEYQDSPSADLADNLPPVLYPITEEAILPELGWLSQLHHCCKAIGLPDTFFESLANLKQEGRESDDVVNRVGNYVADVDKLVRHELDDWALQEIIPASERTIPMTLKEAAKLMGYRGGRPSERLAAAIKDGSITCEKMGRQSYVFSKSLFPQDVWDKVSPPSRSGPKSP